MGKRVLLIVVGLVLAIVLERFGVPRRFALAIGFAPFVILEAKGLVSPYETSALDVLHGSSDSRDESTPGGR